MNAPEKRIAIIGQGVMGLSSAYHLLDQGFKVDIFSKDNFWSTASISAGAYWWPHRVYPEERVTKWAKETYETYKEDQTHPETGISFKQHLRLCIDPDESAYARHILDECEEINGQDYGLNCAEAFLVRLPVIDVPTYMLYLKTQVESKGGQIHIREVSNPLDFYPEYDLVINCSGVGARELVKDESVFPIRGQSVRVSSSPNIVKSTRIYKKNDEFTLVLPRRNDIVVGGTAQDNDWSLEVRAEDTKEIIDRCSKFVPDLQDCEILGATVGLRPGRKEIRLELEIFSGGKPIIHNYGHGGGGYTVAWGCAKEVQDLAKTYLGR